MPVPVPPLIPSDNVMNEAVMNGDILVYGEVNAESVLADEITVSTIEAGRGSFNILSAETITTNFISVSSAIFAQPTMIGFYGALPIIQPTTDITTSSFVAGSGSAVNDDSLFEGYTIGQVVAALKDTGFLK